MIIVLKGADFSKNNIGHVEVTKELDPFTLAAIKASGNTTMTNEQKSALDTFFRSIGAVGNSSSVWSKLERLYIPFLCNDLSKATVNYKTNNIDNALSGERYTLRNKGVTGVVETPGRYTESKIQDDVSINTRDLTILAMLMENDASLVECANLFSYEGNSGNNRWGSSISKAGSGEQIITISGINPSGNANYGIANNYPISYKLMGCSFNSSSDRTYVKVNNLYKLTSENAFLASCGNDTPSKSLCIFTNSVREALSSKSPSIGMSVLGKGMTDAELLTLKSASETLVEFFR